MADSETPTQRDSDAPEARPAPAARATKRQRRTKSTGTVVVAEGKAICCSRFHGIKSAGEEVTADLFDGGQAVLDDLLEKGYLVRA